MHTTNLLLRSMLSTALSLASFTIMAANEPHHHGQTAHAPLVTLPQQPERQPAINALDSAHDHRQEHGGQIYSRLVLDQKWQLNSDGDGALKSDNELRIGTDENKLVLKLHADKAESAQAEYDIKTLYSRNISDFWDAQAGVRYRQENLAAPSTGQQVERLDAVFGLHGLAPYFFETDAYLYIGEDDFVGLSLETTRDLLLSQKLIIQPYAELDVVLQDQARNAKKTGLSHAVLGLETRYEINKKVMPYVDIAYQYAKGDDKTACQESTDSEQGWWYGAGLRMIF